jgi:hypothetical protein
MTFLRILDIFQFLHLLNTHMVRRFLTLALFAECSGSSWFIRCCDVWWWCHQHDIFGNEAIHRFILRSNESTWGISELNNVYLCLFNKVPLAPAPEGANNAPGGTQPVNSAHPGFSAHPIHVAQLQTGGAIPHNMVDTYFFCPSCFPVCIT